MTNSRTKNLQTADLTHEFLNKLAIGGEIKERTKSIFQRTWLCGDGNKDGSGYHISLPGPNGRKILINASSYGNPLLNSQAPSTLLVEMGPYSKRRDRHNAVPGFALSVINGSPNYYSVVLKHDTVPLMEDGIPTINGENNQTIKEIILKILSNVDSELKEKFGQTLPKNPQVLAPGPIKMSE